MESKEEYHDPDYPGASDNAQDESQIATEDGKVEKIRSIIRKEFANELEARENEIIQIDQRLSSTRKLFHRLRYTLVNNFFAEQKLQLTHGHIQDEVSAQNDPKTRNEVTSILRDGQKRLHPSVRKLLGKKTVDLEEIFKSREPRQRSRKDYSAMIKTRNYTIPADATTTLRPQVKCEPSAPAPPMKAPRHIEPKVKNVVTVDDVTRNKTKHRYRIIIGNTSKWSPAGSPLDRSTHVWLVYIRGAGARVLREVVVRLHHSYQPHHTVHLRKPPFQLSRRGWGEFPARIELHFQQPSINRPAHVEHTIKLDRLHTGLQTLGAETIVDVWLYSTQDMLQHEYKEENDLQSTTLDNIKPKLEPIDNTPNEPVPDTNINDNLLQNESWLDFFSKDTTELDVDEMIIKPIKKEKIDNENTDLIPNNEIKQENLESEIAYNLSDTEVKIEPEWNKYDIENPSEQMPSEILSSTSPKKKIMKYMDPTTGKIYYLEMDRDLDLSKVQEIVINSKSNPKVKNSPIKHNGVKNIKKHKKGVSLLKPEIKDSLKNEKETNKIVDNAMFSHLENDHCYLGQNWLTLNENNHTNTDVKHNIKPNIVPNNEIKKEVTLYESLLAVLPRFTNSRVAVSYMLKKIPLISEYARDPNFTKNFPFVVENDERYWKLDFAKRRNIEWSRAKLINKLLHTHLPPDRIWRTKQILSYSRFHGFYPIRPNVTSIHTTNLDWSIYSNEKYEKQELRNLQVNSTLTIFDKEKYTNNISDTVDLCESDEEIEIVKEQVVNIKREVKEGSEKVLEVLPVRSEEERLRFLYVERKCADIGIELRNEDVGNGYSYRVHGHSMTACHRVQCPIFISTQPNLYCSSHSCRDHGLCKEFKTAVHAVLLSAMKSHAEHLIRSSLASKLMEDSGHSTVWVGSSSSLPHIKLHHLPGIEPATSNCDLATLHTQSHTI